MSGATYAVIHSIAERRQRSKGRMPPTPPTPPVEQRKIELGTDLHRVVDEASAALATHPDVYQRDGELVRVIVSEEPDARARNTQGTPKIRPVTLPTLREMLTRVAQFVRWDARQKDWVPAHPTDAVVGAVLARASWPALRALVGITETATLRHDGSVLSEPGYDAATGLLHLPSVEPPAVADAPSQQEAMNALARLLEPFADFPFASDAGRYAVVAAVLTMVARYAIDGAVPMIVMDASTRGSGKSLLMDAVAMITTGRGAPRATYPPNEDELEKTLASFALFGARLIGLDNIAGTLGSAPLDKVLTAEDRVALRVLGRSEIREMRWRAIILASGNNIVLGGDTARRSLVARLEPNVERPEERTGFRHPDLLGHLRAQRGALIADALTVLRGYLVARQAGAAESGETWGSFASWSRLIPAAIVWAGGVSPLGARAVTLGSSEPEADALRTLLAMLPAVSPTGTSARDLVALLWPPADRHGGPRPPDGYDGLREAVECLVPPRRPGDTPDPTRVGRALRRFIGRIVAGRKLVSRQGGGGISLWSSVAVGAEQGAFHV